VLLGLRRQRYVHVGWDVVAEDWEPGRTADRVASDVVEAARAFGDGAVVLLHTWPVSALEALPRILDQLGRAGGRFVTVEELGDRDLGATTDPQSAAENPP